MSLRTTTNLLEVDDDGLAALLDPRDDLLVEQAELTDDGPDGTHRFLCAEGPFETYERTVQAEADGAGRHRVTETIRWDLAIPLWGVLFRPLIATQLRRKEAPARRDPDAPEPTPPWWSPPARLSARSAQVSCASAHPKWKSSPATRCRPSSASTSGW